MTQDEIIEMARQAGMMDTWDGWVSRSVYKASGLQTEDLIAFAKLVHQRGWREGYTSCDNDNKTLTSTLIADAVEEEREACADNVETYYDPMWTEHYEAGNQLAKAIRARGEA